MKSSDAYGNSFISVSAFSSQNRMSISRYIGRRGGEVLLGLLALVHAPVELAEAEVAVGDEGAHAELSARASASR